MSKLLHDSIAYALSHRAEAVEYALQFGRGLDRARTDTFVGMYVNDLTLVYGERGRKGLERLMTEAFEKGLIPKRVPVEFACVTERQCRGSGIRDQGSVEPSIEIPGFSGSLIPSDHGSPTRTTDPDMFLT